jgi:glycosyltransferase involved in cell wall biosynthesis
MRCVIDLQGAQGESRFRGIGRYCLSLVMAMAKVSGEHEVWLALSAAFPDQIERLRATFDRVVPQERIAVFDVPTPCAEMDPANEWRARVAERVREKFLADLKPDLVFLPSLFEGWCDDSVTSVGSFAHDLPTAVVLYDLIPLLRPDEYLPDPRRKAWYQRKLTSLQSAAILTAISKSSRREAIEHAGFAEARVINIGCGVDPKFTPVCVSPEQNAALRSRYGIDGKYVMYSGALDSRKNLDGLIAAFAMLPKDLRDQHQLVLVGSHNANERELLLNRVQVVGLPRRSLVFTGYVSDEDLIALYNGCALYVLPSFHEGFGLPAAEAMASGVPTIGADATAIPEVIGRADALFDPRRPRAIAAKMEEVLSNELLRQQLREHGLLRAKQFTWENCAQAAWQAFEESQRSRAYEGPARPAVIPAHGASRKRLAYFSPLAPVPSGIAQYSAELLPELAKHYEIEAMVFQPSMSDAWVNANCPIRTTSYFEEHADRYDRVLYHLGNSPFHAHMWRLMERYPGTVVLHDFFHSSMMNWIEREAGVPGAFQRALYQSHGYGALLQEQREGRDWATRVFPCNREVLDSAAGVVVHSQHAVELTERWYGPSAAAELAVIPMLRGWQNPDRVRARMRFGFRHDDFVVCCFGMIAETKLNHRLLAAWSKSALAHDSHCRLVFVGEMNYGAYGMQLKQEVESKRLSRRVSFTGLAETGLYNDYLAAANLAVQLRTNSRGETSKAVFDCLANGVPVVVNAHGSLRDLPTDTVIVVPDVFEDAELSAALESLHDQPEVRRQLSANGEALIRSRHDPALVAERYFVAIEHFARTHWRLREEAVVNAIGAVERRPLPEHLDLVRTSSALAKNRVRGGQKRLLLDISATTKDDAKTGIQRVTRAVILAAIQDPPQGFRIEPIRDMGGRYYYARNLMLEMVEADVRIPETPVEPGRGDSYLGLDWSAEAVCSSRSFLDDLRTRGIRTSFVVYDMLPLLLPHCFPPSVEEIYRSWFETIIEVADKLIAISRAVADDILAWLEANRPQRLRPLQVCYWHLGADLEATSPSLGLPDGAEAVLAGIRSRPSFLMVGTIEPRKGYAQVLSAFDQLWENDTDVALVIIGKQGWMVETLAERIRQHRELGRRLFWLVGISDEMLLQTYGNVTALIAASEGEGFGLPLIEAARAGVPLIARDLPVFREVAGEHAYYFKGETPDALSGAILRWLELRAQGAAPQSTNLRWINWQESTKQLMHLVTSGNFYQEWPAPEKHQKESDREAALA